MVKRYMRSCVPIERFSILGWWPVFLLLYILAPSPTLALTHELESFALPNGLKVILKRDTSSPLVALQLWVEAGAADEAPDEVGLAHLLEHILFRGSSEEGKGKLAGEVEKLGGRINGFTSHDRTVYHLVVPASQVQSGLGILARLMHLPSLGEQELRNEIQVVLEEWRQAQDNPRTRVGRELFKMAYRNHPYGRPIIGTPDTLGGMTWERVSRFHARWYSAANMTLVVVGNVESEQTKKNLAQLFADLPERSPPTRNRALEPPQAEPRIAVVRAPVRQSHLVIGFPMPRAANPETPAVDFLAFILGRGESSRLAQKVKIAEGYVNSISASTFTPKDPGLFLIEAQLETVKSLGALKATLKEVFRLREEPVSPSELSRAHVNFERTFVETKETVQGEADRLGRFQALYGNPNYEKSYLETIRKLDARKLQEVTQTFFRADRLSVSLLVPEETAELPDPQEIASLIRSLQGSSGTPQATRENGVLRATLGNGLRILIQEDHRLPLFAVHAGVIGGLLLEHDANNGIHNFIAAMLTQGSPRLTSSQLVHEVEHLGGSLNGSAGNSTLSLAGIFPSENAEKGLEIFLDTLLHPAFPEAELEKKRQETLLRIKNRDERSRAQVFRLFYQTLFRSHPYRLPPAGEREQVLRFHREDLVSHYYRLISPDRVVLTLVGDIDGEEILRHLHHKLSELPQSASSFTPPPAEVEISETRVGKKSTKLKQAHLVLGYPAPAQGHADYFTLKVLEVILSRIGGRLFVDLRDRQGLAYSVGAFSLEDPFQGAFGFYAAGDPANVEGLKEGILREVQRLQEEKVTDPELIRAKNYLLGNYLIARQTNAARAADLTFNELFGFGSDFAQRYREGIEKVSAEDILRAVRQYLSPDRYVLAIVGP